MLSLACCCYQQLIGSVLVRCRYVVAYVFASVSSVLCRQCKFVDIYAPHLSGCASIRSIVDGGVAIPSVVGGIGRGGACCV